MIHIKRLSSAPPEAAEVPKKSTGVNPSRRRRTKSAGSVRSKSVEQLKVCHQQALKSLRDCTDDQTFSSQLDLSPHHSRSDLLTPHSVTVDSGDYCDSFSTRTASSHFLHRRCGSASTGYYSAVIGDSCGELSSHNYSRDEVGHFSPINRHCSSEQDLNSAEQNSEQSRRRRRRRRQLSSEPPLQPSDSVPSLAESSGSSERRRRRRRIAASVSSQQQEQDSQCNLRNQLDTESRLSDSPPSSPSSPQPLSPLSGASERRRRSDINSVNNRHSHSGSQSPQQSPPSPTSTKTLSSPQTPQSSPPSKQRSDSGLPPRLASVSSSGGSRRSRTSKVESLSERQAHLPVHCQDWPSSHSLTPSATSHRQGKGTPSLGGQSRLEEVHHHHHCHHYQEPRSSDHYPVQGQTHHPFLPHPDTIPRPPQHPEILNAPPPAPTPPQTLNHKDKESNKRQRKSSSSPDPESRDKKVRHRSRSVPATSTREPKERYSVARDGDEAMRNLSFCGCGFLGMYHLGVATCLVKHGPSFLSKLDRIAGASAGALVAALLVTSPSVKQIETSTDLVYDMAKLIRKKPLGALTPGFQISKELAKTLDEVLPPDAHELARGKLHISVTDVTTQKNKIFSQFDSRKELIEVLVASCHIPVYSGTKFPSLKGQQFCDGGLTNNMVRFSDGRTVTVSPFSGKQDIGPRDSLKKGKGYFVNLHNQDIQMNFNNFRRMGHAFFPPPSQVLEQYFEMGHNDTSKFLIKEGIYEIIKPGDNPLVYESSV